MPRPRSMNGTIRARCWRSARPATRPIDIYRDDFLIERPMLAALRAPELDRAADRRNRPLGSRVRGLPARIPLRLPDLDPRARHLAGARAAGGDPHLEPHARTARGAAPALRLSLDRLSGPGARGAHRDDARLERRREHRARRGRGRRQAAARAAHQAARHRRGGRLGRGRDPLATARRALAGCVQTLDRRRAQGRGGPRLHLAAGSTRLSRRRRHERSLPRAARPFVAFPRCCAPTASRSRPNRPPRSSQRSPCSVRASSPISAVPALATLAPPPERRAAFDALFGAHFLGERRAEAQARATTRPCACRRTAQAMPSRRSPTRSTRPDRRRPRAEALSLRRFGADERQPSAAPLRPCSARPPAAPAAAIAACARGAGLRHAAHPARGDARNDGDVMRLRRLKRALRQRKHPAADRRVRLDEGAHRGASAHRACAGACGARIEVFTFGTRLTRVTRAMRLKNREQALAAAADSSAIGTAARASATRCRRSSLYPALPAMRAARRC